MAARKAAQLLRVGVGSAALASIPALTYKVYAADDMGSGENRVKITELSVYDNPEDRTQYCLMAEEVSPFREVISDVRQSVWTYLETIQETTDKVKEKFDIGKAHTQGLIDYIQNDPGMLPRAAVITVAGLGGVVAGYRGGVMRKLFYSTTAIVAATSLCYPNEAVELTTEAYTVAATSVKSLWSNEDACAETPPVVQDSSPTTMDNQTLTVRGKETLKGDPGQAKEEDKDLYTTRGC